MNMIAIAACGGLGSVPDDRTRMARLNLSYSYAPQLAEEASLRYSTVSKIIKAWEAGANSTFKT